MVWVVVGWADENSCTTSSPPRNTSRTGYGWLCAGNSDRRYGHIDTEEIKMSLPSSMYMFLSPIGMYLMFGMGVKLIKKEQPSNDNNLNNLSDSGLPDTAERSTEVGE
jgi:hypothetical protein